MNGGDELGQDEPMLIAAASGGSVDAFAELVRMHQSPIRAFLGRVLRVPETVDDVAQDTFLGAYRTLASYDARRSFRSWLFGIAKNLACKHLRGEARRHARESDYFQAQIAEWASEVANADRVEDAVTRLTALRQCMEALPTPSARLIRQHYFDNLSAADIGKRLGRSENAVRILLFRIRQGLRDCVVNRHAASGT
jgi:RNA polymerase sigma-70 factor (ECF subfamily)